MPRKWELPLYSFQLPSRKVVVNVTRSCPNFDVPAPAVSDVVASLRKDNKKRILDFGAGKLRNTLYLLSRRSDFRVWAVEFKECFEKEAGKKRLARAARYQRFFLKKWPDDFLRAVFEVDAVFLINVANVVPDEADRRRIVAECTKRLRKGGWFLWMSQYGEPHYKPGVTKRLQASDGGWFYSLDKEHQTYYKEFSIPEIMAYFSRHRYRQIRQISAAHHRAFIFEKL